MMAHTCTTTTGSGVLRIDQERQPELEIPRTPRRLKCPDLVGPPIVSRLFLYDLPAVTLQAYLQFTLLSHHGRSSG
jgi:hypothetical protein